MFAQDFLQTKGKGIALCFTVALPCTLLVTYIPALKIIGAPVIAILCGMALNLVIKKRDNLNPGIGFTSKYILQTAVVLLGFGLNLATIGRVGLQSLPVIICTVSTSLLVAYAACKLFRIPRNMSVLIGVGSSICGGSAIAATAPVIGADDEEIARAISVIFFYNVIAALIFPALGGLLGLSDAGFGLFAGTAVNDTSSVTAAASTWDTMHNTGGAVLEYATIVKLTRTLAIIPITLILAFYEARKADKAGSGVKKGKMVPRFIIWFVCASVITTLAGAVLSGGALSAAEELFAFLKVLSKFFIVMAMSAVGLNTNVVKLVRNGGKPLILGFLCWIAIACVSLLVQYVTGIM